MKDLEAKLYWESKDKLEAVRWLKSVVVSLQMYEFAAELRDSEKKLFRETGGEGNAPIGFISTLKLSDLSDVMIEYILKYIDDYAKTYSGRITEGRLIVLKRDVRTEYLLRDV